MSTFIEDVIRDLKEQNLNFSETLFILPSKRAGLFVLRSLSQLSSETQFAPTILSIEEFIAELSQLLPLTSTELLFRLYEAYQNTDGISDHDDFETFMGWGQTLLNDFNEIDRYLVDPEKILNYLSAIKDLDHWSLKEEQTPLMRDYVAFWKSLHPLYENLKTRLISDQLGYQGLMYREAVANIENYVQNNSDRHHVFMGFNALNKAEEVIIQELLANESAQIYWDIDHHFIEQENHSAGHFIRKIKQQWRHFQSHPFKWAHDHYTDEKAINFIGVSSQIGQAKYVGQLINNLSTFDGGIENTAVLLGDENLLIPVLCGLDEGIDNINVTMGLPLYTVPFSGLLDQWFKLK